MPEPQASRPSAPDWLGGDEQLPWSWAVQTLNDERNYWLVSIRDDGFPQARPLWGVWLDDLLFLSVGHAGLQRAQQREDGRFDISVHVDSARDVVIVEGTIERIAGRYGSEQRKVIKPFRNADLKKRAGELYEKKYDYSADYINFLVRPQVVYGWRDEKVATATKWTFGSGR